MSHQEKDHDGFDGKLYAHPPMRNALIAGGLTLFSFGLGHLSVISSGYEIVIYILAIIIGGYHWTREGIEEFIESKEIGIELLMLGATVGSAILGMWDEAAFLVFIYGVAEGLEEYAYAKTRASIRKLLDLAPEEARILRNGKEVMIPADKLKVGDVFLVRPGESLATDGTIVKGKSSINEAPVTGESIPVEKKEGMPVFAATINQQGVLEIQVTATFTKNTLSKIVHLVEEAQEKKGKTQQFIEKFGKIYSPIVLISAVALALFSLLDPSLSGWGVRAVVLLVAAAPCALVMSTPVAVAAGIGRAGSEGVLIKGGAYLENLGKIKAVAFDKTGTLTLGKPVVTDIVPVSGDEKKTLALAYSIEKFDNHPLAQAIVKKAESLDIKSLPSSDFVAMSGFGTKAIIDGRTVYVGKKDLFTKLNMTSFESKITKLREEGKTIVLVGSDEAVYGIIAVRDEARPVAKQVIKTLHGMGMAVVMLTGDNQVTAQAIAKKLGIDQVKADLKPEDKVAAIKELKKEYGVVAMVGDGINDAPALAESSVGIAMGTAGTDAAIEAADVALMGDDLTKISYAIGLGRKARGISLQNIIFSILILIVLVPSALIGILSVAIAVAVHEVAELIAVGNGLRVAKRNNKS
ncbi:heavy metal translocating P-type ATPase [Microgenomates bacterium UTCPR1]|nr:MAG: heavy metal translocating P-type ATPase [Microgenomates bacterium UTCPR1]